MSIIQENISLKDFNSWKVGGPAQYFALPTSVAEIKQSLEFAASKGLKVTPLGGGTNVLIADTGIQGFVLCLKKFNGIESENLENRLIIRALSGTKKSDLLKIFIQNKLDPALFLTGLPGDVGGGVVMNAGVGEERIPREFCEIVDWVEVIRGSDSNFEIEKVNSDKINWTYRHSDGWQPGIITTVQMSWPMEQKLEIIKQIKDATKKRVLTQPLNMPSCGSTFVNPPGNKSGALIESSGLKGFQIGGAQVSEKHANFIVNTGDATATDVHSVIEHVKKVVAEKHNIQLTTEIKYLGQW